MKKAILIGNGFTLYLNSAYHNTPMMEKFSKREPKLVKNIEQMFDIIRNLSVKDNELVNITEGLFLSKSLRVSETLTVSTDAISTSNVIKEQVIIKLVQLGFNNPNEIFDLYFSDYGLLYSINKEKLKGIETYLKVVALFEGINKFTKEEYLQIKNIATEIYFNEGRNGLRAITNKCIDNEKLINIVKSFDYIFTTNYDTVLDDILESDNRFPYHLHGGFSICHRNRDPDGRYSPNEARLFWGINAEEKYEELSVGWDFGDIDFNAIRNGQSRLADYYDILQNSEIDEIYILGYSGENDDHINKRIIENEFIKKVVLYVDPSKINDKATQVRSRLLFGREKKYVEIKPWCEFWDRVVAK